MMVNYKIIGDERERALLAEIRNSRNYDNVPAVRDPDRHIDTPKGRAEVCGLEFDFTWAIEGVLLELDGGQRSPGGGRHNSDRDRWKTLHAISKGWRVLHVSWMMFENDPAGVLEVLAAVLENGR